MLKENGYQESVISKIFKRITNNLSFSQSQQQTWVTDNPRGGDQNEYKCTIARSR